jgi:hypothetical protein
MTGASQLSIYSGPSDTDASKQIRNVDALWTPAADVSLDFRLLGSEHC